MQTLVLESLLNVAGFVASGQVIAVSKGSLDARFVREFKRF